jgi:2-keto-3-deoxy-L-rhamnonate aldolase RhmA
MEHSHLSFETVLTHLMAARACRTAALVRVRGSDLPSIKPLLDAGADGIIVPQVRSAAEVQCIASMCRYAPLGQRGYGPRRAADYGRDGGAEYMERANAQLFVAVQIENRDALNELDAIAAVKEIDSLALGPFDLSIALGHPGELHHPEVLAAMLRVVAAARSAGKYIGTGVGTYAPDIKCLGDLGIQWMQCGDDYGYMIGAATQLVEQVRKLTIPAGGSS